MGNNDSIYDREQVYESFYNDFVDQSTLPKLQASSSQSQFQSKKGSFSHKKSSFRTLEKKESQIIKSKYNLSTMLNSRLETEEDQHSCKKLKKV